MSENISIHCSTEEEFDKVKKKNNILERVTFDPSYKDDLDYEGHGICLGGRWDGLHGGIKGHREDGYTIITAGSYLKEVKDEVIFQVGNRVECVDNDSDNGRCGTIKDIEFPEQGPTTLLHIIWDIPSCNGRKESRLHASRFKLLTSKPKTTKEEEMSTSININSTVAKVFPKGGRDAQVSV